MFCYQQPAGRPANLSRYLNENSGLSSRRADSIVHFNNISNKTQNQTHRGIYFQLSLQDKLPVLPKNSHLPAKARLSVEAVPLKQEKPTLVSITHFYGQPEPQTPKRNAAFTFSFITQNSPITALFKPAHYDKILTTTCLLAALSVSW